MNYLSKYNFSLDETAITSSIQSIASNLDGLMDRETLLKCFSLQDLTTLHPNDTEESVLKLVGKVNSLKTDWPEYPLPASICVYPNFASVVKSARVCPEIHVTTVASCFPSTQSFLEVKVRECELAVRNGADEIDIVLALAKFLGRDEQGAFDEIVEMKAAIDRVAAEQNRHVILKVILETGLLRTADLIAEASFLAMEAGADFIKTSTGKVDVNATPFSAFVMCEAIRAYYEKTGRKVGFKAAGGISSAKDAVYYYLIAKNVLGSEWLDKSLLRFGVSRLGNNLMSEIEQKTVTLF